MAVDRVILTIERLSDGKVKVTGPIGDKVLALGLLEFAKTVVLEYREEAKVNSGSSAVGSVPFIPFRGTS